MTTARSLPFQLPPLPYAESALEPMMSSRTLSFHHGKHHKAYVDKLNDLVEHEPELRSLELEPLVQRAAKDSIAPAIFANAAQAWNHAFFWQSMRPKGGGQASGRIARQIDAAYGDHSGFVAAFSDAAMNLFGSGWVWLIEDGGKLAVTSTANAGTPMAQGKHCLLTLDLWEHAYYLDHQDRRQAYVTTYLDRLVNWEFAEKNLG
jgi:superoxide dismutase, Fe-Mn family